MNAVKCINSQYTFHIISTLKLTLTCLYKSKWLCAFIRHIIYLALGNNHVLLTHWHVRMIKSLCYDYPMYCEIYSTTCAAWGLHWLNYIKPVHIWTFRAVACSFSLEMMGFSPWGPYRWYVILGNKQGRTLHPQNHVAPWPRLQICWSRM